MGESAESWAAVNRKNLWGTVPSVVEMQSEGGAAGTVHGALQTGALATTFTASQGLLLMIPNMFKIAGELTPAVFHVAARSLAYQALSIFGDHSDVMSARSCGWAMLCGSSTQEAADFAAISHAATLESRIPFINFFDGFRTSHEIGKIADITDDTLNGMIKQEWLDSFRERALTPDAPVLRGTAQNPDVYFQGRETVNRFYEATPAIVQNAMDKFAELTGRSYHLVDYTGAPDAERVIILMGSGAEAVEETVEAMRPGSVIIDLAASTGGNCELTKDNETIVHKGVKIIGNSHFPTDMPTDASRMYGKNMINFLKLIITKEGALNLNWEDDIVKGTAVTHGKEIVHERVKAAIGG